MEDGITGEWLDTLGGSYCCDAGCYYFKNGAGLEIILSPLGDAEKQWHVGFAYKDEFFNPPNLFERRGELMKVFDVFGYNPPILVIR